MFFTFSHAGSAASFPCHGELSTQERLICADKGLSALDVRLAALYSVAVQLAVPAEPLRPEQSEWLGSVRAMCGDVACLTTVYRERVDNVVEFIQENALPLPSTVSGKVRHAATESSYCDVSGVEGPEGGDWFYVTASVNGASVSGSIDGVFDCGRKIWGEKEIKGRLVGNIALVEFRPGWSDSQDQGAVAMIAVGPNRIYWRVLSDISVESYVPIAEDIRVQ